MIADKLQGMIAESMKAHDEVRVSTLRLLSSAFNYERIEKQHDLTGEEELAVVRKQAKQRKDSIEALRQAQGKPTTSSEEEISNRIGREKAELKILQEFLPPEMTDEELEKLVDQAVIATGAKIMSEMGMVIGKVKSAAPGVDGGRIAQVVRQKLRSGS
jgi:uncharacterized protein YqeY